MSDVITTELRPAETPGEGPPKLAVRDLVKTRRSTSGAVVTAVDHVTFDARSPTAAR